MSDPQPPAWPDALTEREREIIRLVGQGLSNKDIAYKLSISDSTVRHHMTSIFDKVGVPNRQKAPDPRASCSAPRLFNPLLASNPYAPTAASPLQAMNLLR